MIRLFRIPALLLAGGLAVPAAAEPPAAAIGITAPLESFSEVIERPLFAPDRKRHIKAAPATPAAKPVLSAIVMLKDRRYAVLQEGKSAGRRVKEGDAVGSMTVKKILRDRIVMAAADGAETVMHLFSDQPAETTKSASSTAPPPIPTVTAGVTPAGNRPPKPLITSNP